MKKGLFFILFLSFISPAFSQTLFTYGQHNVSTTEFLNAYNKNKAPGASDKTALRNYLNLYTIFKLKVQAAKNLQMDTLPALQADVQNFRAQIEPNFLKDTIKMNALMDEAFKRSQKDIHMLGYFVEIPAITDSAKMLKQVNNIKQQLAAGRKSVEQIIAEAKNAGIGITANDFGFITVFTLPYKYENIIYNLKPGEFSNPYNNKSGWHIFKNESERPAVGKITLAQILIGVPPNVEKEKLGAKKLVDSIYNLLQHGRDFGTLAKQFSTDRTTYMQEGKMAEFGVGKYKPNFERVAFSLKKDNEISKPFETAFGYHIIKRLSREPVATSKNDEIFMYHLKQNVVADSRILSAKTQFVTSIKPRIGFTQNSISKKDLWQLTDSSLLENKNIIAGGVDENTTLFWYNDGSKTKASDWVLFVRNSGKAQQNNIHGVYKMLWPKFIAYSAVENYRQRLLDFDPKFKAQIEEFKEGNLLFEVMQQLVWNKAAKDTISLQKFYKQHTENYLWKASADVFIFSCANKAIAENAIKQLKAGLPVDSLMKTFPNKLQMDSSRYELKQIPAAKKTDFTAGLITNPVISEYDGTAVFAKIVRLYPAGRQRKFEDARGLVISDYQKYLDTKWIEQLKQQYPVNINEKVFQSLVK